MGVTILEGVNLKKLSGEKDGYSYQYIESLDPGHAAYRINTPDGDGRLVDCTADAANELADSPKDFWDKYIK